MDRRIDERFSLLMLAKVTLLDHPQRERDYLLSEVSATGLKLIGQEQLPVGTLIGLDLERHLLLAEVRYSYMRGTSSITGAMNLRISPKEHLDGSSAKFTALESEYQSHGPSGEIDLATVFPSLRNEAASRPAAAPTISAAAVLQSIFEEQRDQMDIVEKPAPNESSPTQVWEPEGTVAVSETEWAEETVEPVPSSSAEELSVAEALPEATSETVEYSSPRLESNSGLVRTLVFLGLVAGVVAGLYVLSPNSDLPKPAAQIAPPKTPVQEEVSAHPADAVSQPVEPVKPAAASKPNPEKKSVATRTPTAQLAVAPASQVRSENTSALHHALLRVTAENWVSACTDGKPVLVKLLAAGEERRFDFNERMVLRTGNAGSAHIDVNGKYVGDVGPSGGVRLIELTPSGYRLLNSHTPVKDCDVR
jgi:hypothetical protein